MIPTRRLAVAVAVAALLACRREAPQAVASPGPSLPPGHPPIDSAAARPPVADPRGGGAPLTWTVPTGWTEQTPTSSMRRAQYRVAGTAGAAECVVFYFGPGQGGDAKSNAERWASQFSPADGRSSEAAMKTSSLAVGDIQVLLVEVTGTYAGGMAMGGAAPAEQPNSMLLGAIAEGPDANWFFKLTGPEATVRAQRAAFEQMIRSLRKGQ